MINVTNVTNKKIHQAVLLIIVFLDQRMQKLKEQICTKRIIILRNKPRPLLEPSLEYARNIALGNNTLMRDIYKKFSFRLLIKKKYYSVFNSIFEFHLSYWGLIEKRLKLLGWSPKQFMKIIIKIINHLFWISYK